MSLHSLKWIRNVSGGVFRLRELSNKLVKYDDSTVAQIIEATNEISAIYDELDFWVSDHGILRKINNRDHVYSKWEKVREYLTYKYPMSSYEMILAKEKELADETVFMNNIRYMHFMYVLFPTIRQVYARRTFQTP